MSLTLGIIASSRGNIVPPLDTFGGAAAAYSTRLLSSAYGGSAVRVRRSFDNAEQDIGFSGGAINETALMNFVGYQNLYIQSQTFTAVNWTKGASTVTANAGTDPFGGNTATRWLSDVGATTHYLAQAQSLTVGQSYTVSFWVKSNTVSNQSFRLYGSNGIISSDLTATTDWQRFSFSFVATSATDHGIARPTSNAAVDLLIFGAQLNVGTTAQPYQITTSAARSGDGFVTKWYTQDSNGENLLLQSQTFENSYWTKVQSSVTANATTAPDGTLTAEKLIDNTVNTYHSCTSNAFPITGSIPYTISLYVKVAELSNVSLTLYSDVPPYDTSFSVNANLTAGTSVGLANGAAVLLSSGISNVGSGWYRIWATGLTNRTNIHRFDIALGTFAGTGTQGFFIWGAQLSQSSWLQGYQVTTTAAILRRDASQSTAANQPRIVGGGVIERENGKASIFFDGVNDFLSLASDITYTTTGNQYVSAVFTPATAVTASTPAYVILNGTATVDTRILYSIGSTTGSLTNERVAFLKSNSGLLLGYGQTISDLSPTPKLQSISFDPPSLFNIFQNSIQQQFSITIDGPMSASQYPSTFGRIGANQTGVVLFFGDMQEIILYGTARSANRADIDRNVGAYYQTQWTGASSGLLDQFGGAAAAYSLRNLSSSYRGPLIRVRRSSDNAETDIGGTYSGDLDIASLLSFTGGQNLVTNSEDFTNANWGKVGSTVTANATIAPDGALTADKLNETAATSQHVTLHTFTISTLSVYTLSFYAKAAERSNVSLSIYLNSGAFDSMGANFDLTNGIVQLTGTSGAGIIISQSIQSVGNGWWRCSITGTTNKTGSHTAQLGILNSSFQNSYLGVAGSGVYVWGAQLNTGILQPYIPTTTTAVNGANAFVTKWYTQDNNYQNLVLQSQTFENASWQKFNSVVVQDTIAAPDGTLTADSLNETAVNNRFPIFQDFILSAVGLFTCSVYLKAKERRYASVSITTGATNTIRYGVIVDLQDGLIVSANFQNSPTNTSNSISSVGNGWYRVSLSMTATVITAASNYIIITPSNSATPVYASSSLEPTYLGTAGWGIYIWGAQANEGSVAQPYTATTTTVSQRRDAIQSTAASQPRIVNSGGVESEGNRPSLFFDGVDDRFVPSAFGDVFQNVGYANLFFAARNISTDANQKAIFSTSIGTIAFTRVILAKQTDGTIITGGRRLDADSGVVIAGGSFVESTVIGAALLQYQTSDAYLYSNSNLVASNTSFLTDGNTSNTASAAFSIGSDYGFSANSFWNGDMQELVFYNTNRFPNVSSINSNTNSYFQIYWQGNGTALLDNYSGASAAYSLRNLSSAYTGPLIRVRRSGDNVERDIYGTFGGDLDIASLVAFVGANSGFVTTWYDQSGSARHAVQGTAANQPRIVNAGVVDTQNGKPSVVFDGSSDFLQDSTNNPFTFTGPVSLIHASYKNSTAYKPYETLFSAGTTGNATNNTNKTIGFGYGNELSVNPKPAIVTDSWTPSGVQQNGTVAVNQSRIVGYYIPNWSTHRTAGQTSIRSNGVDLSVIPYGALNPSSLNTNPIKIGGYDTILADGFFAGSIFEIVAYASNQVVSRIPIESNINNYYKIY